MLQHRFRPAIALIALVMLCSLVITQRSTAARAQSIDVTSAPEATAAPMVYLANADNGLKIFRIDPTLFPQSIFVPLISQS